MSSGLSEDFLFVKYKRAAKETAEGLAMKCFTHHLAPSSMIPFESHACLKVERKIRIETGYLGSNVFILICT